MTYSLTPINILDAAGATKPVISYNDGTNNAVAHSLLDNAGALISPAVLTSQVVIAPTVTVTAGAYTPGFVVGGLLSLAGASRVNAGSGTIQNALVTVKTALNQPYDVFFFNTNPTNSTFTDNAALAINVADLPSLAGIVHCTDLVSGGTPQILQSINQVGFKLSASATTLYAVIVIRGSQSFASTSAVSLIVDILQD